MQAFLEHTNTSTLKQKMNPKYHNSFDELNSLIRLRKIIQANINKFVTVKPDRILAEIKAKLPAYFHDLIKACYGLVAEGRHRCARPMPLASTRTRARARPKPASPLRNGSVFILADSFRRVPRDLVVVFPFFFNLI
jgi:hypothetical protein